MTDASSFFSPKTHGFVRVAAATPVAHVGDPKANAGEHLALIRQAGEQGVDLMVFPELSLSAYAIDDLHMQAALLEEVERQIAGSGRGDGRRRSGRRGRGADPQRRRPCSIAPW